MEIGKALGVVGAESSFEAATYQAELRGVTVVGPAQVEVRFGKARGAIDAVKVYLRRAGQAAWTLAGMAMRSPWIDHTPLATAGTPEVREYRVQAVIDDQEIGLPSDAAQVTVA